MKVTKKRDSKSGKVLRKKFKVTETYKSPGELAYPTLSARLKVLGNIGQGAFLACLASPACSTSPAGLDLGELEKIAIGNPVGNLKASCVPGKVHRCPGCGSAISRKQPMALMLMQDRGEFRLRFAHEEGDCLAQAKEKRQVDRVWNAEQLKKGEDVVSENEPKF